MSKTRILLLVFLLILLSVEVDIDNGDTASFPQSAVEQAAAHPAGEWADEEHSLYYLYGTTSTFSDDITNEHKLLYTAQLQMSLEMLPEHIVKKIDGLLVSFNTGHTCARERALGCFTARNFSIFFGVDNIHTDTDAIALLLHEIGHAVDYAMMKEEGRGRDFRTHSHESTFPINLHANKAVPTGYSTTNPKEDFAESFFVYMMYPEYLKKCCQARYEFFKDNIFLNREYTKEFPATERINAKFASGRFAR